MINALLCWFLPGLFGALILRGYVKEKTEVWIWLLAICLGMASVVMVIGFIFLEEVLPRMKGSCKLITELLNKKL